MWRGTRLPARAATLVSLAPNVIVGITQQQLLHSNTHMVASGDPVAYGFVKSLAASIRGRMAR
jgi:precorrin-6B methylase 1